METIKKMLKALLSMQGIGLILTFITVLLAYFTFVKDYGGRMSQLYDGSEVESGQERVVVVIYSPDTVNLCAHQIPISLVYENPEKYSIKGFYAKHVVHCAAGIMNVVPSPDYSSKRDGNIYIYSYTENRLLSHSQTSPLFSYLSVMGEGGTCSIESSASYDGLDEVKKFKLVIWSARLLRPYGMSYDEWHDWAISVLKDIEDYDCFDAYLISPDSEGHCCESLKGFCPKEEKE